MKKFTYIMISIISVLAGVQCSKVENGMLPVDKSTGYIENKGDKVFMSVPVGKSDDTKTTISKLSTTWNIGDKLSVVGSTSGCLGFIKAESSGKTVKFSGDLEKWTGSQDLHFYYLGNREIAYGETSYTYDVTSQCGTLQHIADKLQLMHGKLENIEASTKELDPLSMENLMAVAYMDLMTGTGFNNSINVQCSTLATATLTLTTGLLSNETAGKIALKNPTATYYAAFIPNSQNFKFCQPGTAEYLFNADTPLAKNQFITANADGDPIAVGIKGGIPGYIEDGWGYGPGIEIDGVIWAPVNCGVGYNYAFPYGKIYQFGRKVGSGYNDVKTYLETSYQTVTTGQSALPDDDKFYAGSGDWYSSATRLPIWPKSITDAGFNVEKISDPCPVGWRVPTKAELDALIANHSSWTTASVAGKNQNGYYFSGSSAYSESGNRVFLSAAGERTFNTGVSGYREDWGCYWTNLGVSNTDNNAYFIVFGEGEPRAPKASTANRSNGYSVRCVKETTPHYVDDKSEDRGAGIKVGDVIWAPVNCGYDENHKYGLLYQWGRKYPSGYSDAEGWLQTLVTGPVTADKEDPASFYTGPDWLTPFDNTRWNSAVSPDDATQTGKITPIKTSNDPCPLGWRVPTYYELNALLGPKTQNQQTTGTGIYSGVTGVYLDGTYGATSGVFLPLAGYRLPTGDYSVADRNNYGNYWTSSVVDNTYAYALTYGSSESKMHSDRTRELGFSIRCVYDAN